MASIPLAALRKRQQLNEDAYYKTLQCIVFMEKTGDQAGVLGGCTFKQADKEAGLPPHNFEQASALSLGGGAGMALHLPPHSCVVGLLPPPHAPSFHLRMLPYPFRRSSR